MCRVNADVFTKLQTQTSRHRRFRDRVRVAVELTHSLEFATRTGAKLHDAIVTVSDEL